MDFIDGIPIIDNSVDSDFMFPRNTYRGMEPRDYRVHPYGTLRCGTTLPFDPIKDTDVDGLIDEQEATESRLDHMWKQAGVKGTDQRQTNYCWAHGPANAMHAIGARNKQPFVRLSPASVAAPIKGFRNNGGLGIQAVEYMAENGINAETEWPENAIDRRYFTQANKDLAKTRQVEFWYEGNPQQNMWKQCRDLVLNRIPVAIGSNAWRHEVCGLAWKRIERGSYGLLIVNSWLSSGWGDEWCMGILREGGRYRPDDIVAPLSFEPTRS